MNRIELLLFPAIVLLSILVQKNLLSPGENVSPARVARAEINAPPPLQADSPFLHLASAAESWGSFIKETVFNTGQISRDLIVLHILAPRDIRALLVIPLAPGCDKDAEVKIRAEAFLIGDFKTNKTYLSRNTDARRPIASLTKLMTAVIAQKQTDKNNEARISASAAEMHGTAGEFRGGDVFTIGDLIKAILVVSSNDAALTVAEHAGERKFIDAMRSKALELEMFDTSYIEPTGLSPLNQSTVNDVAKLMRYAVNEHTELFLISRQPETKIVELRTGEARNLVNINQFAHENNWKFLGGKTGFIEESGRNLAALFSTNGHVVLTIVLGADNAFTETKTLLNLCLPSTQ